VLLKDAIEEFLEYLVVELNRSEVTQKGYKKDLKSFANYLESQGMSNITVDELTAEIISGYILLLNKEKKCQPNTLRRHITAIKSFCNFLVSSDYLEHSPAEYQKWPRKPQKLPRHLQKDEVDKLIETIPEKGSPSMLRDKTALMLLYYTGVRVSELVNIHTSDIDLDLGFIGILKGKGNSSRKVPIHQKLSAQLDRYYREAPEMSNGYLFCNKQGEPITADYVHYMIEEYAKKAGMNKSVSPHMFRHSFATHLYREDTKLPVLGKLLGHNLITSTAGYVHTDLKHLREGVEKLEVSEALEKILTETEA